MGASITAMSEFMGHEWQWEEAIALIEPEFEYHTDPNGVFVGDYLIVRDEKLTDVVCHEMAHHYNFGPKWINEGGAEFLTAYTLQADEMTGLESRYLQVERSVPACHPNVQALLDFSAEWSRRFFLENRVCQYVMGEYFLLGMYFGLGAKVVSAALWKLHGTRSVRETDIYQAFFANTPSEQQDRFRSLYTHLHGGPIREAELRPVTSCDPARDREALLALYHATDGPNWKLIGGWLSDDPFVDVVMPSLESHIVSRK